MFGSRRWAREVRREGDVDVGLCGDVTGEATRNSG